MRFFLLVIIGMLLHPVHLSVTNVEYLPHEKEFLLYFRIFTDDLQRAIYLNSGTKLNLTDEQTNNSKKLINDYVFAKFEMIVDGKKIDKEQFKLYEIENQEMSVGLYYKLKFKTSPRNIVFTNKLLFDLYRDQKNLLIFAMGKKQQGLTFTYKTFKQKVTL